ncbi:MAG: hypothetical protein QOJ91_942 [Sphingomonadales bacterium]|jgi:hypothetical protein|nr:hypothetical protein [Sphingomonadales bacterium]
MDDDWEFPAPREDPEARKVAPGGRSGGCPHIVPDGNFVEGDMDEDTGDGPPPSP